jgi:hypothetical protein
VATSGAAVAAALPLPTLLSATNTTVRSPIFNATAASSLSALNNNSGSGGGLNTAIAPAVPNLTFVREAQSAGVVVLPESNVTALNRVSPTHIDI